jgi:hypothetical protein
MTLGVPFYGYDFTNPTNVTAFTFAEMVNMDPAYAQLDQVGSMYYNGFPTIVQKTILAQDETSGIMIWELGQDYFGNFSLLKRIDETIKGITLATAFDKEVSTKTIIYPNPLLDVVHIKLDAQNDVKVTLFSQSLKLLKIQHYRSQEEISLDMRNCASGMYFLAVESEALKEMFKVIKI